MSNRLNYNNARRWRRLTLIAAALWTLGFAMLTLLRIVWINETDQIAVWLVGLAVVAVAGLGVPWAMRSR